MSDDVNTNMTPAPPAEAVPEAGGPSGGKKKKEKIQYETTLQERILYPVFAMGQNMSSGMIGGFMLLFMTDTLFIDPLICSAMLLVTRVWDAINDPLFGIIVDRSHFKSGKFKPWMRAASIAVPLTTALMFLVPTTFPMGLKIILVTLFYMMWDMSYTMADVPNLSMLTSITSNLNERTHLLSLTGVIGLVGTVIFQVGLVPQIETIGFRPVAVIVSVVVFVCMFFFPMVAKERNRETVVAEERYKLRDIWDYVKGNKYMLYFFAFFCIFGMFNIPLSVYVLTNCVPGGLANMAYYTLAGIPFLLGSYLVVPQLAKRFDRLKLFKIMIFVLISAGVSAFFAGYSNAAVYGIFYVLKATLLVGTMLLLTLATDFVEYGNYKTGMRKEGITFAAQTFSSKFVGATAAAMAAVVLGLIKYNGEAAVQSASTLQWLWILSNWLPVAGIVVGLPFLFKVNYRTADIQIMADINTGKISREEGDALMSRKY